MLSRPALALGLALLPGLATRALAETLPVTLAQALELVDRQSPDLAAVRERAAAQAAQAEATGRAAWPRLSLSLDGFSTDNPARVFASKLNRGEFGEADFAVDRLNDPGSLSHLTTALSLEVPVDVFGRVKERAASQDALARAATAQGLEAAQQSRLQAAEAYQRAVLAREALGVTRAALAGARAREADLGARVQEGAALSADLLRARARRRQREADLADRQGDLAIALASLARILGAPDGTRYEPVEATAAPGPLEGTLEEWQARALAARGSLTGARERLAGTERARRTEEHSILPDLALYGQLQDDRSFSGASGQSYAVGFSVRWNGFDPTRGKRVAAAASQERAAALEERAAAEQARLEVEIAWQRASSARARHAAAAGGAEEGREALRVVQERRKAGMATLTDELETEAASLAAQLEELKAAADAAVADAALKRAAGEL